MFLTHNLQQLTLGKTVINRLLVGPAVHAPINIFSLTRMRELLKSSLEKSREIGFALAKSGSGFEDANERMVSLEEAIRRIGSHCLDFTTIKVQVDGAVGPATSVVKLCNVVSEIDVSLSENKMLSDDDLFDYILNLKHLEEALRFLTNNCMLVIHWLEDVAHCLADNKLTEEDNRYDSYICTVNKCLKTFMVLQSLEERARLKGGSLYNALQKLENEFRHLLEEIDFRLIDEEDSDAIAKIQAIIQTLQSHSYLERCVSIYVDVRSLKAQASLQALDMNAEHGHVDQWRTRLEFLVKYLLEAEYRLCGLVFDKLGLSTNGFFAKIVMQCGIRDLIEYGNTTIMQGKKEAVKLLRLLEIFATLNGLRTEFNQLFGGKACGVESQTRELVKNVVNGACEIFWELSVQVELQSQSDFHPPLDGSTPRLVNFVRNYSNQLLDDDYYPIMIQVLEIQRSWNNNQRETELLDNEFVVLNEVKNIVKALEINLDKWADRYDDDVLSHIFKMNYHWCLCKNASGTKLGDKMGESWIKQHEDRIQYHAGEYMRKSWGKLPEILTVEGLTLFEGGRAVDRRVVTKIIKEFDEAFAETFRQQKGYVVSDKVLRWKLCEAIVDTVVPVYKSYVETYIMPMSWCSDNVSRGAGFEKTVRSLFQPNISKSSAGNNSNATCARLIGDENNVITNNHYSSTSAVA